MCYDEKMLGIKARGEAETDYHSWINAYMGNTYDLILRVDISDIKIKKDLTISLHNERSTFENDIRLEAHIIPDDDDNAIRYGSVSLKSNTQIVYEYVKDSASLNLDNGSDLAKTLLERSSVSFTKDQLGGISILEFRVALRSVPLEINLSVDYDEFEKEPEDNSEYLLTAGGTDFYVTITNIGDQVEKGIQVVLLPPVELDYVVFSDTLNTGVPENDLSQNVCKDGAYFQDLRPGDSIIVHFQLKLSDRIILPEEAVNHASIQTYVHIRTATAGYRYCDLSMYPLFPEDYEDQSKSKSTTEGLFDCPSVEVLDSYCPGRKMIEFHEEPEVPSLNTIKNHPMVGDERQFIYLRNYDRSERFTTYKELNPGDVVEVIVFFHNPYWERCLFKSIVYVDLPHRVVGGEVTSMKASIKQEKSSPPFIWSEIKLHAKEEIRLEVADDLVVLYGRTFNRGEFIDPKQLFETGWMIDDGLGFKPKFISSKLFGYILFRIRALPI